MEQIRLMIMLLLLGSSYEKDADESRPYEFGFTIDGEQHRHEKKDVNGIIQGEFGFITADGIYHVTVYATDENGAFKIISMKNTRISEPLDRGGKPTSVGQIQTPQQLPTNKPLVQQVTTKLYNDKVPKFTIPQQRATTSNPIYDFTTASTYRNGCSGCGIVTNPPLGPLKFQNPAFNDQPKNKPIANTLQRSSPINNIHTGSTPNKPSYQNPLDPRFSDNPYKTGPVSINHPGVVPFEETKIIHTANPNQIPRTPKSRFSQLTVSDGAIKVPGNAPIPIKDKYPNMANGLPQGITERDITNLLYKFNYTVGFHGHYEKGLKDGSKVGGYFVNGRDGYSRVVTYVADETGYHSKFTLINLGFDSADTPKADTEKKFGLKNYEFIWYPIN